MLQWYIRAFADLSVNVKTYQPSISSTVARDELTPPFLVIALRNANKGLQSINKYTPSSHNIVTYNRSLFLKNYTVRFIYELHEGSLQRTALQPKVGQG